MDITQINHSLFKANASSPVNFSIEHLAEPAAWNQQAPYTDVMLREYYHLVSALTKLDAAQLQKICNEVDRVIDDLALWLDTPKSINTIELFSAMRHLKQRANMLSRQLSHSFSAGKLLKPMRYLAANNYMV